MKNAFMLGLMLLFLCPSENTAQIRFFHGSWAEARAKATREGKLIFVDCYAQWCDPCKIMARDVFPDPNVGAFFNKYFVCLKEDMEGQLRADFGPWVEAYPTLLIFNADGYFLKKRRGAIFNPNDFIQFGASGL